MYYFIVLPFFYLPFSLSSLFSSLCFFPLLFPLIPLGSLPPLIRVVDSKNGLGSLSKFNRYELQVRKQKKNDLSETWIFFQCLNAHPFLMLLQAFPA